MFINDYFDWFFLHELNILWNFFSLAYPCLCCELRWLYLIYQPMIIQVSESARALRYSFEPYIVNCVFISHKLVIEIFWRKKKLEVCIEIGKICIVIVRCIFWSVTKIDKF